MDLEEWEFLSDDGLIDYHEDGEKKTLVRKRNSDPKSVFNMNYFMCPSPTSPRIMEPSSSPSPPPPPPPPLRNSRVVPNHIVTVPIQLEPTIDEVPNDDSNKQIIAKVDISIVPSATIEKIKVPIIEPLEVDQDAVSQVFFKKMKENEFVDMKMDSPKSSSRGIMPQIDAGAFNFDDKTEAYRGDTIETINFPRNKELVAKKSHIVDSDSKEENTGGLINIWKWSLTSGIGAICSFGVAAATMCIIILGNHQRSKQHQDFRFQIYTDDKRIKQVVHHATKLNEAISAVRGMPITGAHITFGGYHEGL
ncbi:hypothetical protein CFOL_v3_22419 [Cephalotus follicularis]|uniref:DUF6821 domain-containing protein n=1 Tax=Cephalotus follicularis TaxID=3775 RepID=A0A1Q3CFD8_CEPFO|nr:hypothetical protein CFOL_v3_22419 [Cephalotus follicularis]